MPQDHVQRPQQASWLSRFFSKLSCKPQPQEVKKKLPRRSFAIGAQVIDLEEVKANNSSADEPRFIREFRYSKSHDQWLYQLSGKNFKNNAVWVTQDSLKGYPKHRGSGTKAKVGDGYT